MGGDVSDCDVRPHGFRHEWHGFPREVKVYLVRRGEAGPGFHVYVTCLGPYRAKHNPDVPDRPACARCSTGFPIECRCPPALLRAAYALPHPRHRREEVA